MKLREDYPVYLDPTFEEVVELAQSGWDTVRIGVTAKEPQHLLLGSGFGNTHETLCVLYRRGDPKRKREFIDTMILYKEDGIAYFNCDDVSHGDRCRYPRWTEIFTEQHVEVLKDLIRESGLAL